MAAPAVTPPWAVESSTGPEPIRSMKHVHAAAALSTAKAVLYPSPDDPAPKERTGKKVVNGPGGGKPEQCPYATGPVNEHVNQHKRPLLQVDKFTIGSEKVGTTPLDNEVYRNNLIESRARMANSRSVNYKGAGDVANRM